ncbi:hypothetical protein ACERII_18025 [Evansella sp. AB-rgal1]|uniref:hypothetical protein n=1 Tax=Evansella sp. AB-rgal1 TaxID=3242696 RepID=UPI00359F010B
MKELKGLWKILWLDIRRSYSIFWSILLFFVILGIGISISFPQGEVSWNMDGAVLIYQIVIGAMLFRIAFDYGSTFGSTRKLMYVGVVSFLFILSLVSAFLLNALYFLLQPLLSVLDVNMELNSLLHMSTISENFFGYLLILFTIYVFSSTVSMLLSILKQQVGAIALYGTAGIFALTVILPAVNTYWVDLFYWFSRAPLLNMFLWILLVSVVLLCIPVPFVRQFQIFSDKK